MPIIGAVLGLLGAILPEGLKLYKDREDKKHELEVMKLQMQMQAEGHTQRLEEIVTYADVRDSESAREYAKVYEPKPSGKWWYDVLMLLNYIYNSTVRPTLTYLVICMYMFVKFAQIKMLSTQGLNIYEAVNKAWTADDTTFVFLIITFWFGGRQILRSAGRIK